MGMSFSQMYPLYLIRTAASLFGLGIAFTNIQEIQNLVVGIAMMVMAVVTFSIGSFRYFTLKKGLEDPGMRQSIPVLLLEIHGFHRVGVKYYVGLCTICFFGILIERFYDSIASFINNNTDGK
jgi:hypothetical protein